jgi:16S rRNA (guanine1207-N2)-methyltransferase
VQDDALRGLPTASADVIVCNPPFHAGTSLDTDVAQRMFREAGRVLRPGGQLWTVYNSPLPYRNAMTRSVGRTVVVDSNRKFTVTVSIKPS